MPTQLFTIGLLMLFAAMLPGPDFALVTKNTLRYSRRSGFFTTMGLGSAALVHISYCAFWLIVYVLEIFFIIILWFSSLVFILSHPRVAQLLEKAEKYIIKILGSFLIGFGVLLLFAKK